LNGAFEEHHGPQFLSFHRSTHDTASSWLSNALLKGIVPPSMARNVMLVDFLFGTVKELAETVHSLASVPADRQGQAGGHRRRAGGIKTARLEFCKRELIEFRERNPQLSRNEILGALGATAQDLRAHARDWYEEHMPPPIGRRGRPPQYAESLLREQAEDLKQHILARYTAEINSRQRPRRITLRLLVTGHSLSTRIQEVREAVPELGKIIDRSLEDTPAFQHRLVRWFVEYPRRVPPGVGRISFISSSTGLSASKVAHIIDSLQYQRMFNIEDEACGEAGALGGRV
jgi:hypothetical protein